MTSSSDTTWSLGENTQHNSSLGSLLGLLCKTARIAYDPAAFPSSFRYKIDMPLARFLRKHSDLVVLVQQYTGVPFVVKQKSGKRTNLLYEGRFLGEPYTRRPRRGVNSSSVPVAAVGAWHIVLGDDGSVEKCSKKVASCPKNHVLPKDAAGDGGEASLARLLLGKEGDDGSSPDPQSRQETLEWLSARGFDCNVDINFCVKLLPVSVPVYWIALPHQNDLGLEVTKPYVRLEAYTGRANRLKFRRPRIVARGHRRPKHQNAAGGASTQKEDERVTPPASEAEAAFQHNRASAVKVTLTGLSFALKLGMLTSVAEERGISDRELFVSLCSSLSKAAGSIWIHVDAAGQPRHLGFRDGLGFFKTFEIFPHLCSIPAADDVHRRDSQDDAREEDSGQQNDVNFVRRETKAWLSWKLAFEEIWKRRQILLEHKARVLAPVIDRWSAAAAGAADNQQQVNGSYQSCIRSLQRCLKKITILCYCKSDAFLHSVKIWFAHFVEEKQQKRRVGVSLRTVNQTQIVCLVTPEMNIENIRHLVDFDMAERSVYEDEGLYLLSLCDEWRRSSAQTSTRDALPPKPLVDNRLLDLHNQGTVYSPGHISGYAKGFKSCMNLRADVLTRATLELYQNFCEYLCQSYSLDLTTCPFQTVASIAFKCTMLSFWEKGGPSCQSIEKMKTHYSDALRKLCRGGFSYSCHDLLSSGEALLTSAEKEGGGSGGSEVASTVMEFDLKSSYGYSSCQMSAPGSFCIGYSSTVSRNVLERTDETTRANSFEYCATMALLMAAEATGHPISAVFSNFSPLGICYISKYPVDLVIVFENNRTVLFQLDGLYAHGCRKKLCPTLKSYVHGQTEQEVMNKTKARDDFLNAWVANNNSSGRMRTVYTVLTDCHDEGFRMSDLLSEQQYPELAKIRKPYNSLPRHHLTVPEDLFSADKDLTYLLIGGGKIPEHLRKRGHIGPLFVWKTGPNGNRYQDFGWEIEETVFTRDTLEYLVRSHGFQLTSASSCYFYKKCNTVGRVFEDFVCERQRLAEAGKPQRANFLKAVVNYSTGMFGLRDRSAKSASANVRLTSNITQKMASNLLTTQFNFVGQLGEHTFAIVKRLGGGSSGTIVGATATADTAACGGSAVRRGKRKKASNSALPIYASIVEFGKYRLLDCISFIDSCVRPGSARVLYSQVDNILLALSERELEDAVAPEKRTKFESQRDSYFGDGSPGLLVKKWAISGKKDEDDGETCRSWKFASAMPCSYGLVTTNAEVGNSISRGQLKMSGFKNVTVDEAYESNARALRGEENLVLSQERRVNRLLTTETRVVQVKASKAQPVNQK